MQMLMGYHNYYTDRRLIPSVGGNGLKYLSNNYANELDDLSLIYYRTFTIMADVLEEKIEINCNILFSFEKTRGSYLLELTDDNSPYPWIQYYDWIVYVPCQEIDITCTMNKWGEINVSAPGYATITGTYKINKRVKIIINLQITE